MNAIVINGVMTRIGECDGCELTGVLRKKPIVPKRSYVETSIEAAGDLEILDLCVTCFETPTGCVSENMKPII